MKLNLNSKLCTPTYLITQEGPIRIDHILDMIDECIEAVLKGSYVHLPMGLYSDAELDEYEAHLDSLTQEENPSQWSEEF